MKLQIKYVCIFLAGMILVVNSMHAEELDTQDARLAKFPEIEENRMFTTAATVQKVRKPRYGSNLSRVRRSYVTNSDNNLKTLLNGPFSISNNFELYYGLGLDLGCSTLSWSEGLAIARTMAGVDIFLELDFNNKVSIFPENYLMQVELGLDSRGADIAMLNYFHINLFPFGYKWVFDKFSVGTKLGIGLGFPLNDFDPWHTLVTPGDFQCNLIGGAGIYYKNFGYFLNIEYGLTEIGPTLVPLHNLALYASVSYKFGKLKH